MIDNNNNEIVSPIDSDILVPASILSLPLKPAEKMLLITLIAHLDDIGTALVSAKELALSIGVTKRTAIYCTQDLVDKGYITRVRTVCKNKSNLPNAYTINFDAIVQGVQS